MRNEVIIDPSLRLVYKERYEEDACQDYIELDWIMMHKLLIRVAGDRNIAVFG